MPRTYAKPAAQSLHSPVLQSALADQTERTHYRVLGSRPRRRSRRALRPAPHARAKPGVRRCRRGFVVANVALLRSARMAGGPAVNPRAQHGDKKFAVE